MSSSVPRFLCWIRQGRLCIEDQARFGIYLAGLGNEQMELVVRKVKKERSSPQNKYYWGVVVDLIAEHTGTERMLMHEILKNRFLSKVVYIKTKDGVEESVVGQSTVELKTDEFEKYLESVRQWAADKLGVVIPLPNEVEVV